LPRSSSHGIIRSALADQVEPFSEMKLFCGLLSFMVILTVSTGFSDLSWTV
jgi:hypothetical protein